MSQEEYAASQKANCKDENGWTATWNDTTNSCDWARATLVKRLGLMEDMIACGNEGKEWDTMTMTCMTHEEYMQSQKDNCVDENGWTAHWNEETKMCDWHRASLALFSIEEMMACHNEGKVWDTMSMTCMTQEEYAASQKANCKDENGWTATWNDATNSCDWARAPLALFSIEEMMACHNEGKVWDTMSMTCMTQEEYAASQKA